MKKILLTLLMLATGCAGTKAPLVVQPQQQTTAVDTTVTIIAPAQIVFITPADMDSSIVWYNKGAKAFRDSNYIFAEECFRKASQLNPNDLDSEIWLASTLDHLDKKGEAAGIYEKVIKLDKGRSDVHYALGVLYYQLNRDSLAVKSLQQAIYIQQNVDSAKVPMEYWEILGDASIGINDGGGSLYAYAQALAGATIKEDSIYFQRKIDWASWDDCNIRATKLRDEAEAFTTQHLYQQAAEKYNKAIDLTKTKSARDELIYSLALVEYQHLNNPEVAIGLLRKISGVNLIYYDALGMILHNEGVKMVNERNLKQALVYLTEAAQLTWKLQPLSCLELAKLYSQFPTKTAEAIKWAEKAVELGLGSAAQQGAYQLLISLNRRLGNFEEMRKWGDKLRGVQ